MICNIFSQKFLKFISENYSTRKIKLFSAVSQRMSDANSLLQHLRVFKECKSCWAFMQRLFFFFLFVFVTDVDNSRKENFLTLYLEAGQRWCGRSKSASHWIKENISIQQSLLAPLTSAMTPVHLSHFLCVYAEQQNKLVCGHVLYCYLCVDNFLL